jgi:uncharacterized protein YkwD
MKMLFLVNPLSKANIRLSKVIFLFVICITFLSCHKDDVDFNLKTNSDEVFFNSIETEVLLIVNKHRENLGLKLLSPINQAYYEASIHTIYMIDQGKISHDNFIVRSKNLMTTVNARIVLENVAAGFTTAEGVVNGWLDSPLHKKNIEDPNVQFMGVSVKKCASGRIYYTQIFVGR